MDGVFFIRSLGAIQQISLTAKSYERNAVEDIDLPHVQELFEKGADGNGYSFAHNILVDYYGFSRATLRNDKESPEPQTAQ